MNHQLKRSIIEVLNELKRNEEYTFVSKKKVYSIERWVGVSSCEADDDDEYPFDEDDENEMEGEALMRSFMNENKGHEILLNVPFKRESFVGRNDPCPCGSGKKYKKRCLVDAL